MSSKYLSIFLIIISLLVFGEIIYDYTHNNHLKIISISGINKKEEIRSKEPIKLVISRSNLLLKVSKGTEVKEIVVSGINVTIYLPKESSPKVSDGGINTRILYY